MAVSWCLAGWLVGWLAGWLVGVTGCDVVVLCVVCVEYERALFVYHSITQSFLLELSTNESIMFGLGKNENMFVDTILPVFAVVASIAVSISSHRYQHNNRNHLNSTKNFFPQIDFVEIGFGGNVFIMGR